MNVSAPRYTLALSLRPLSGSFDVDALGAASLSGGIVAGLASFSGRLGLASAQCEPPMKSKSKSPKKARARSSTCQHRQELRYRKSLANDGTKSAWDHMIHLTSDWIMMLSECNGIGQRSESAGPAVDASIWCRRAKMGRKLWPWQKSRACMQSPPPALIKLNDLFQSSIKI